MGEVGNKVRLNSAVGVGYRIRVGSQASDLNLSRECPRDLLVSRSEQELNLGVGRLMDPARGAGV